MNENTILRLPNSCKLQGLPGLFDHSLVLCIQCLLLFEHSVVLIYFANREENNAPNGLRWSEGVEIRWVG